MNERNGLYLEAVLINISSESHYAEINMHTVKEKKLHIIKIKRSLILIFSWKAFKVDSNK